MDVIGGFWTDDPRGKHGQRYWDGHTWTSYVCDFGFTSRDPLPGGTLYPSPHLSGTAPAAQQVAVVEPLPDSPRRRDERRLIVGIPAHVVAALVTAGGWLLVLPVIALWRRGSRPLAASWVATVVLIVLAAASITGRMPDAASTPAAAFADDGSAAGPAPRLVASDVVVPGDLAAVSRAPGGAPAGRPRAAARTAVLAAALPQDEAVTAASTASATTSATAEPTGTSPATAPTTTSPPDATVSPEPTTSASAAPSTSTTAAPTTSRPSTEPTVTPQPATSYASCGLLTRDHPHGVGSPGAVDLVPADDEPVTSFTIDGPLYLVNAALDGDDDGIACERA